MYDQSAENAAKKKYRCSCGRSFSRSDVLVRHMRTCQNAQSLLEDRGVGSEKQSRTKKACNRCAKSKVKCDAQQPCQRCQARSMPCEYTRTGYLDRWESFQISDSPMAASQTSNSIGSDSASTRPAQSSRSEDTLFTNTPTFSNVIYPMTSARVPGIDQSNVLDLGQESSATSTEYLQASFLPGFGPGAVNISLDEDWDSLLAVPEWFDASDPCFDLPIVAERNETNLSGDHLEGQFSTGLLLRQIDSVESKCVEIRNFLQGTQAGLPPSPTLEYITRDRLVNSIQLYGKHYQPIQPLLHLPTFDLTKTSASLLLAMMLIGACYSSNDIPAATIVKYAIHALHIMEAAPHERIMAKPPLPTIQAHTLLCQVLICTKNPTAYKFATLHRGRTFSMAERAGLFEPSEPFDYQTISPSTFDWSLWIEAEMRRRLVYHIFIDDIGGNIFTRCSSHISPFTLHVDTPCYDRCWFAPTANECLKVLQSMPAQPQLATALRVLRSAKPDHHFLFDASDCGMLQIIMALHHVLFRAMEDSLDDENTIPPRTISGGIPPTRLNLYHLLNHDIAAIADDFVSKYGSGSLKHANDALDAWRRNWDVRRVHDVYSERSSSFSHPLNFWLLAKLFVVIHFFRNHVLSSTDDGQQQQGQNSDFAAFLGAHDSSVGDRIKVQLLVIDWLSQIRQQQQDGQPLSAETFLSQVLNT